MKPMVTRKRLMQLFTYEQDTGLFIRRVSIGRHGCKKAGQVAGTLNPDLYVVIGIDGRYYKASRLAWFYMTGRWPKHEIDHRNTVSWDNCWENLREATRTINAQNQLGARKNSKSGLRGVHWHKRVKKWASGIGVNNRSKHLGYFDDPMDGHLAYLAAKRLLHPGSTV